MDLQEINFKDLWSAKALKVPKIKKIKIKPFKLGAGEIKFKFINKHKRSVLAEGRNKGMAYTFAKREEDKLVSAYPLTCCKDFLNDEVYSEITGNPYNIYGLKSFKQNLFDENVGFMVISIEKEGRDLIEYKGYLEDYKTLQSNYPNLQKFINYFEDKFKLEQKTVIGQIKENRYLVIVPMFWCEATYRISLYSLLLRIGMYWNGEIDVLKFLYDFDKNSEDKYFVNSIKNKLQKMLDGEIPEQDLSKLNNPHNEGIIGFNGF